jgi:phosphate transport system permease protein
MIELLAGIPSVVLGFFSLMVMATFLQNVFGFTYRLNTISAGIALSFAVIPIIYTIAEDSLSSVPNSYREASISLGANSWQTAYKIVFPSALPGIFAAIILGFGRAIGETMIVLMASGNAAIFSFSFLESTRTLSATIAAELAETIVGSVHYHILFFIGVLLFIFTFFTNLVGQYFVLKVKKKISG